MPLCMSTLAERFWSPWLGVSGGSQVAVELEAQATFGREKNMCFTI